MTSASVDINNGKSNTPPKTRWISVSTTVRSSSLDYKNSIRYQVSNRKKLANMVSSLVTAGGGSSISSRIVDAMIQQGMVKTYTDQYLSALLGPKTRRINFVFPDIIISAVDNPIIPMREKIKALGKKGTVEGVTLYSNFDMDIVIVDVDPDTIDELLKTNPEWFKGKLMLIPAETCDDLGVK
ncbi:TPA_asm: M [Ficus alphacytorhabdovirus 1]|nr:TPA_asm: M [Ficus alphacytorhabdovirus 1]